MARRFGALATILAVSAIAGVSASARAEETDGTRPKAAITDEAAEGTAKRATADLRAGALGGAVDAEALEKLATYIQAEGARQNHPALAVGVVTRDGLRLARALGVRDHHKGGAVTERTVFRIASITKVFASHAFLILRDAGKLDLDDPITRFLPEANTLRASRNAPPITLRHLVTHTSGLPRDLPAGTLTTEAEFLRMLPIVRVDHAVGQTISYSNLGMALAGPIIHRASGVSFREFMQANIFGPLGMTQTCWEESQVPRGDLAVGYLRATETRKPFQTTTEWRMGAAESFGGIYSSVDDLAKFVRFELAAWDTKSEQHSPSDSIPLKRTSVRESHTPGITLGGTPSKYGISWVLADDPVHGPRVEHTGATDEYSASISMLPRRGIGVIVLASTQAPWDTEALARRIAKKAVEVLMLPKD